MKRFAMITAAALVLIGGQATQTVVIAKMSDRADKVVESNAHLADTITQDDATIKGLSETVATQSTAIDRQTKAISAAADILGQLQGIDAFLRDNWPIPPAPVLPPVVEPSPPPPPAEPPTIILGPPPLLDTTTTTIRHCAIIQLLGICI